MALMAYLIPQGKISSSLTGIGFMFSDINMVSILGAVIAGVFICGDFENKTIHDAISTGFNRGTVIISKVIVYFCSIGLILLPYAIVTIIALSTGFEFSMGSVAIGFLNMLTADTMAVFSTSTIGQLLITMLVLTIVYMAQLSICVPLAFILKKQVYVVAIYYGLSILSGQLMLLADSSSIFNQIFTRTPFGGNHAFLTLDTVASDILKALGVSFTFIILIIIVTYTLFRKAEIK